MSEYHFNLLEEPWIPVKLKNNQFKVLNIKDTLLKANEIIRISSSNPLVEISIHRLLLAILHRNFGPKDRQEWFELYQLGNWDDRKLSNYFSKWYAKFDLFGDEKSRFYQIDISEEIDNSTPVTKLHHALSSGNNAALFDHNWDSEVRPVPVEQAIQLLISFQNFAVGGGVSRPFNYSHAPLVSGFAVLLHGKNLFETQMLNFIRYDVDHPFKMIESNKDIPFWERKEKVLDQNKRGRFPFGYLDLLTWQSRRIWLEPLYVDNKICIKHLKLAQGEKIKEMWNEDPQMVYIFDKKNQKRSLRLQPDKQVWRDTESLLRLNDTTNKTIPPKAINWVSLLIQENMIPYSNRYSIEIYGLCNDPSKAAKIINWSHAYIPLPLIYLTDQSLVDNVKSFLAKCEKVERILNKTMYFFAKQYLFPDSTSLSSTQNTRLNDFIQSYQLRIRFWNMIENYFYSFIEEIAEARDIGKRNDILNTTVEKIISRSGDLLNSVKENLKNDPRAFKSLTQNFGYFFSKVKNM